MKMVGGTLEEPDPTSSCKSTVNPLLDLWETSLSESEKYYLHEELQNGPGRYEVIVSIF